MTSMFFKFDPDKANKDLQAAKDDLKAAVTDLDNKRSQLKDNTGWDNTISQSLGTARAQVNSAGDYYNQLVKQYKDFPGVKVPSPPTVTTTNSFGIYGSFDTWSIPPEICTGFPPPSNTAEPIPDPPSTKPVVESPLAPSNPKPKGKPTGKPKVLPPKTKGINKAKPKKPVSVKKPATIKGSRPATRIPKPAPPSIAPAVMQAVPGGSLNGRPYTGIGPDKTMTK